MIISEFWKPVAAFPKYAVSNLGRVKRLVDGKGVIAGHVMRQRANRDGYLCVTLQAGRKSRKSYLVSRLVCEAFHGMPPSRDHHAAHLDGVKSNNSESNLEWKTNVENELDKLRHGTIVVGESHANSKLTESLVLKIRSDHRPQRTIAREIGVAQSLISLIKTHKIWVHVP